MNEGRFDITQRRSRADTTNERIGGFVQCLERESGRSLNVRFHRNRWTYFSCRTIAHSPRVRVSLHEVFLDAPAEVIRALATLIRRNDKGARGVVRTFVKVQSALWDGRADYRPRQPKIVPRGRVYDLQSLFNELNRGYFDGRCSATITWGNGRRSARGQQHITFGTYDKTTNIIRIHPALDHHRIPEYFVRYITFHEMLHATLPPPLSPSGRRLYHSRLFRQRERMFEDFQRAQTYGNHFVGKVI
jgi:hypothetical protein